MNENSTTIGELLAHPKIKGLVSQEEMKKIAENLDKSKQISNNPMYIRILLGIGAWFATVFVLLAFGISGLFDDSTATIVCGILFLTAAIIIARINKNTFLNQLSLALAFSGNALILIRVAEIFLWHEISTVLLIHAAICVVIYPLYANSIYRFFAPTVLVILATWWIVKEEVFVLIHMLIAAEMLLSAILLLWRKRPSLLTPLVYSAAIMLPATLLFMNLTQMDIWRTDFNEPLWPSSLLLTVGLIYLYFHLAGGSRRLCEPWMILAIGSTALLGTFTTPGIIVAIGLLVMGRVFGDRILTMLSYLFLLCFLVFFYYALNVDLAYKSFVVAGSGVLLLVVRWILGYCRPKEVTT
jgi:hypothetical protein